MDADKDDSIQGGNSDRQNILRQDSEGLLHGLIH